MRSKRPSSKCEKRTSGAKTRNIDAEKVWKGEAAGEREKKHRKVESIEKAGGGEGGVCACE